MDPLSLEELDLGFYLHRALGTEMRSAEREPVEFAKAGKPNALEGEPGTSQGRSERLLGASKTRSTGESQDEQLTPTVAETPGVRVDYDHYRR
jgi:hypothetical protein